MTENPVQVKDDQLTDLHEVEKLRVLVGQQAEMIAALEKQNKELSKRIGELEEELRAKKKLNKKPQLSASKLNVGKQQKQQHGDGKRPGSAKRSKKARFVVDTEWKIEPSQLPVGARFNGYREYDVQELSIERNNIRFYLAEYVLPDGGVISAQLPPQYRNTGHYGPELVGYILHEYYHNRVTQPLIREQLVEWGVEISIGQINSYLSQKIDQFHLEQASVLAAGLKCSKYVHTDDTGARHSGKNGYCTVIGNQWFTYFASTARKTRRNFLSVLQANAPIYVLNEDARQYLESYGLADKHMKALSFGSTVLGNSPQQWNTYLESIGIVQTKAVQWVTEAALVGGLIESGINRDLLILSDGARQFNILIHGLCWVHAERIIRKLEGSTAKFRENIEEVLSLLWEYYQQLKAYKKNPSTKQKEHLSAYFDQIFGRCYLHHPTLNNALNQFRQNKEQLLLVLDFPEIPLHNNAAESDIREFVTRRKISGGTRSEAGRKARDTMIGLKKTCRKLGICFWAYLLSRLRGDDNIPPLPDLIRQKAIEHGLVGNPA